MLDGSLSSVGTASSPSQGRTPKSLKPSSPDTPRRSLITPISVGSGSGPHGPPGCPWRPIPLLPSGVNRGASPDKGPAGRQSRASRRSIKRPFLLPPPGGHQYDVLDVVSQPQDTLSTSPTYNCKIEARPRACRRYRSRPFTTSGDRRYEIYKLEYDRWNDPDRGRSGRIRPDPYDSSGERRPTEGRPYLEWHGLGGGLPYGLVGGLPCDQVTAATSPTPPACSPTWFCGLHRADRNDDNHLVGGTYSYDIRHRLDQAGLAGYYGHTWRGIRRVG
jgi:hypothetical protein